MGVGVPENCGEEGNTDVVVLLGFTVVASDITFCSACFLRFLTTINQVMMIIMIATITAIADASPSRNVLKALLYIKRGNVCVVSPGPPIVVSQIKSKILKFHTKARKPTNQIILPSRGNVM